MRMCLFVWSEVNFQTLFYCCNLPGPTLNLFQTLKIVFPHKTSPGDVVVVYLVVADVPVVLQPVQAVQTLSVVVRERLVKATVDSVLNDEHSEMRS